MKTNWLLEWHYRSEDERLIAFSNHHIYSDRLVTFPSAVAHDTIEHKLVLPGNGHPGQAESPSQEIVKVIELVMEHMRKRPHESLGVITMGIKHANRIQAALDRELGSRMLDNDFFLLDRQEPFFIKNLETVQGDERDAIILSIGYGKNAEGDLPHRFGPLTHDTGHRRLNVAVTRARRRITVVSSFSHHEVDLMRSGSRGVELLKYYLEYTAGGGNQLTRSANWGEVPLNPFEADIKDALAAAGIPLLPQYGASQYRIDLVALHPGKPGRPVLAIECDGASYHSSATARDRDRIRQQHLMRLGWRFHRIWSPDWFTSREEEIRRAVAAFEEAIDYADMLDAGDNGGDGQYGENGEGKAGGEERDGKNDKDGKVFSQEAQKETKFLGIKKHASNVIKTPERKPLPHIQMRSDIREYSRFELRSIAEWAMSDGLLRTDEELMQDMRKVLGFSRVGTRIREAFEQALRDYRMQSRQIKR